MKIETSVFDRLAEMASIIARHPDYPGKELTIKLYIDDINTLFVDGWITREQSEGLRRALAPGLPDLP